MKSFSRSMLLALACLTAGAAPAWAQTATKLLTSGPKGQKKNVVIVGEGFTAGAGQTAFNNYVTNVLMAQVFTEGPVGENLNAFNITRVNVTSTQAGVTQVDMNGNPLLDMMGNPIIVNTAFQLRDSNDWNQCWYGYNNAGNSPALIAGALDPLVPERDYTIIVLNANTTANGCARGNEIMIDLGTAWSVVAHELGHQIGNLGDEYVNSVGTNSEDGAGANTCSDGMDNGGEGVADFLDPDCWVVGNFTAAEPGEVNLTKNTNRATLKWRQFVNPNTALPTALGMGITQSETAGAFPGAKGTFATGIFRPVYNGRMFSNTPSFGPVEYDAMKNNLKKWHQHTFEKKYVGDFNGDGRSDLVIHNGMTLELYISNGTHMVPTWIQTLNIPGWDYFLENDQFYVGDFDGDNKDDLYVFNGTDFSVRYLGLLKSNGNNFSLIKRYDDTLPGWEMQKHDQFFVANFDGDDKDDLYVFNGDDWAVGYLGMLKATGTELQVAKRYDDILPGWDSMKKNDKFFVANVEGTGGQDLYVFNFGDWDRGYLMSMKSTGATLLNLQRHDGELTGWDDLLAHDQFFVADFDGDGDDDLYAFNGDQWDKPYLGIIRSSNGILDTPFLYRDSVAGWGTLARSDQFVVANVNGDTRKDLYVFNGKDWGTTKYLGVLTASGTGLDGFWTKNKIGGPAPVTSWTLNDSDKLLAGNFDGTPMGQPARDDIIISSVLSTGQFLGLLRGNGNGFTSIATYWNWIHDHEFHSLGYW